MTSSLHSLSFGAQDPGRLATFWGAILHRDVDGTTLLPSDHEEIPIRFVQSDVPKVEPNQMHFDTTTTSWDDQTATVAKVISLGGRKLAFDLPPDELHVPMSDPEGNEFCVFPHADRA